MHEQAEYRPTPRARDAAEATRLSSIDQRRRPSCMILLGSDDSNYFNGRLPNGLYSARFGRQTPHLSHRIADFLRYETEMQRITLVWSEYDCDVENVIEEALATTPRRSERRSYDPEVLVHSTPPDRISGIRAEGRILPASMLDQRQVTGRRVGFEDLGEPTEYVEFVHFATLGSAVGEVVVLSHRDGRINTDFSAIYAPGARIYLRFDLLLSDGVLCRDGIHMTKARGPVDLDRYAIDILTVSELPDREQWTPSTFAEAADAEFIARHPRYQRSLP